MCGKCFDALQTQFTGISVIYSNTLQNCLQFNRAFDYNDRKVSQSAHSFAYVIITIGIIYITASRCVCVCVFGHRNAHTNSYETQYYPYEIFMTVLNAFSLTCTHTHIHTYYANTVRGSRTTIRTDYSPADTLLTCMYIMLLLSAHL